MEGKVHGGSLLPSMDLVAKGCEIQLQPHGTGGGDSEDVDSLHSEFDAVVVNEITHHEQAMWITQGGGE
jgi:hypothetical protein